MDLLPSLTGSEKQVAWAEKIRASVPAPTNLSGMLVGVSLAIDDSDLDSNQKKSCRAFVLEEAGRLWTEALISRTEAKFWIDKRGHHTSFVMEAKLLSLVQLYVEAVESGKSIDELQKEQLVKIEEDKKQAAELAELEKAAKDEGTILVEGAVSPLVAEVTPAGRSVQVRFPEVNAALRDIVKAHGCSWSSSKGYWFVNTPSHWTNADQAARIGNSLLRGKFNILILDESIRQMAVTGSFTPEVVRWVKHNKATGKFAITWDRNERDFYEESQKLPGARWDRTSGSTLVPAEAFAEVEDFADRNGFVFSEAATALLAEGRERRLAKLGITVAAKAVDPVPTASVSRASLDAETVGSEISDELKD